MARDQVLTLEENQVGTPQFEHRKKMIEAEAKRKKENIVTADWIEIVPNPHSKKGGKVLKVVQMKSGAKYRTFIGHAKQCAEVLAAAKKAGKLKTHGA